MANQREPDCFQLISKDELAMLSEKRTQVSYLKGEMIFKQGAFAPHVLFIQSGLIKVYLQTGIRKVQNLWVARSGDFLAFSSMFDKKIYPYSALTLTDAEILMIDKESLGKLLRSNPEFGFRITSRNFHSENHLLEIIANLSSKQMRGKLASALIYLSSEPFLQEDLYSHLTRQDIAEFASISVESVIKFLKEFENDGILTLDGKQVWIRDPERLRRISETA
jgi:CRP/FNR family transcriptional regulator